MSRTKVARLAVLATLRSVALLLGSTNCVSGQTGALTIGEPDGPPYATFGHITDVEIDGQGNVFVLDEYSFAVRVFSPRGQHLASVGREGQGPSEFRELVASAIDAKGQLHVIDNGNSRISTFGFNGRELTLRASSKLQFPALDVCAIGDTRYLLTIASPNNPGPLIRAIDPTGRVLTTFGSPEIPSEDLRPILEGRLDFHNYGFLYCDAANKRVVLLHRDIPLLRSFTLAGREEWRRTLNEYHVQRYERVATGRAAGRCCVYNLPDPASGTYHTAYGIGPAGSSRLYVSLRESEVGPPPRRLTHELRIIDALTGLEIERHAVGGVVAGIRNGLMYSFVQRPFPQLLVDRAPG